MESQHYDIVVIGGGMAGSVFGGVAARSGNGLLIVEREALFRDRVRGEVAHPWGVNEALTAGLGDLLARIDCLDLTAYQAYAAGEPTDLISWADFSVNQTDMISFSHPKFQEEAFLWAADQGATMLRPAKATGFRAGSKPGVTIVDRGRELEVTADLVVGADGRTSKTRQWTGGTTARDREHHRIGGGLFENVTLPSGIFHEAIAPGVGVWAFERSTGHVRVYIVAASEVVADSGADRDATAFAAYANTVFPNGAFADAQRAGPCAFFSNAESWATEIAGNQVVLIGDAAGASDPSRGHGTSLLFRDVRLLSDLLSDARTTTDAISEFAVRRKVYFETIREVIRWLSVLMFEAGPGAARRYERHLKAVEQDPTLGGFLLLEGIGPDDLVPDEDARRMFFGEHVA
jgi:menaquinone-9 beta-reductase